MDLNRSSMRNRDLSETKWSKKAKSSANHRNMTVRIDGAKLYHKANHPNLEENFDIAIVDGGSDTCGTIGGKAWIIEYETERRVTVSGFAKNGTQKHNIPIGSGITATDLPNRETVLLGLNESTILGELSVVQMRENGVVVDDKSRRHGGFR